MNKNVFNIMPLIIREKRFYKIISFALMLICCASLATAVDLQLPKPDVLSEETIYLTQKMSAYYETLLIKEFSVEGVEFSNVNDEEKIKIQLMLPLLKSNVTLALESELKSKKIYKNIVKSGAAPGRTVIIEGYFIEFNAGNRMLKYVGGGKPSIKFKGRLIDGASGKELATFAGSEIGSRGEIAVEGFENLFPYQAKGIGESLSTFLEKLY